MVEPVALDFDALYADAEAEEREGICPYCEDVAFEEGEPTPLRLLCWCGVCLKYHHDDYSHEPMNEQPPDFDWTEDGERITVR